MFGKILKNRLTISAILIGYCVYIIKLFVQNDIGLYIHPRYSIFSVVMSSIAVIILVLGLFLNKSSKQITSNIPFKSYFLDIIVISILVLAFVLPPSTLSTSAIGRKSLSSPTYDSQSDNALDDTACPINEAASLEEWVYDIGQYPISCNKGKSIELTGFVIDSTDNPLPSDMYYLGRVVMSCCIIDARPYVLPIKVGEFQRYPKKTWLIVTGTLRTAEINGKEQLVVEPKSVTETESPSQQYEYINSSQ